MKTWKTLSSLSQCLQSLSDELVYYFPNPGWAGDQLIAEATYQLFNQYSISYQLIFPHTDLTNKIVVYGGGGNLVPLYNDAANFIRMALPKVRRLILLPQTILGHETLIRSFDERVEVFCREPVSFAYVTKLANRSRVHLHPDLVFALDTKKVLQRPPSHASQQSPFSTFVRSAHINLTKMKLLLWRWCGNEELFAFRQDKESLRKALPSRNVDLSFHLYEPGWTPEIVGRVSANLLKCLNQFSAIHTDRLHICIAATLLNKRVYFHPNNYFKNDSVYHYSLKPHFLKISWNGGAN